MCWSTEGEQDHLFDTGWAFRIMRELVCAQSVTGAHLSRHVKAPSSTAKSAI